MIRTKEDFFNLLVLPIKIKGYELIDIEFNRHGSEKIMQLFIDSPLGIGLDDCVAVNQIALEVLGNDDPIFKTNTLEVSSPGIYRKLITIDHFKAFVGQRIKVRLQQKHRGIKKAIGVLQACSEKKIRLIIEKDGSELDIPLLQITKANLQPMLDF
tara:strand:+ start:5403 stop:5870 length:468 start_codon:yes stop_codon:yes gene_type:complete